MIGYADFTAVKAGWIRYHDDTAEAVRLANEWITDNNVDVINVETILSVANGYSSSHSIRVWYRFDEPEADGESDELTDDSVSADPNDDRFIIGDEVARP